MGLDVYLYKYDGDIDEIKNKENKYYSEVELLWGKIAGNKKYDDVTEEEKKEIRKQKKEVALSLGLNEDGSSPLKYKVQIDSKLYQDHLFKVGYLRSSYNSGGFNSILRELLKKDLYTIFPEAKNEGHYIVVPNWENSKKICNEMIKELKTIVEEAGSYYVYEIINDKYTTQVSSKGQALELFIKELKDHDGKSSFGKNTGYQNKNGTFYLEKPLSVHGIINGETNNSKPATTYLIIKNEEDEGYDWYLSALEIVGETIDLVLNSQEKNKFVFHWSG